MKLEGERNGLDQRLRETQETCRGLEDDLRLVREEKTLLERDSKQLKVLYYHRYVFIIINDDAGSDVASSVRKRSIRIMLYFSVTSAF